MTPEEFADLQPGDTVVWISKPGDTTLGSFISNKFLTVVQVGGAFCREEVIVDAPDETKKFSKMRGHAHYSNFAIHTSEPELFI
jgi:hypothetical protein